MRLQGYEPRKLRTWISRTGGAPALSGKDSISHILWLQHARPDVARATWKYLEPKDWLNLQLTGRCAATFDSIVLHWVTDNRDPAHIDYDPELLRIAEIDRAQLPDLVAATSVVGPLTRRPRPPSSACPRASRSWAAHPTCSRPRSVRARCATSKVTSTSARRRG